MKIVRKSLKLLWKLILGLAIFIVNYIAFAFVVPKFTVNRTDTNPNEDVAIYIKTNGVHTDIVVPIKTKFKNWSKIVKFEDIASKDSTMRYIGFGWGDKGFISTHHSGQILNLVPLSKQLLI